MEQADRVTENESAVGVLPPKSRIVMHETARCGEDHCRGVLLVSPPARTSVEGCELVVRDACDPCDRDQRALTGSHTFV
jgi:hypothetical protein